VVVFGRWYDAFFLFIKRIGLEQFSDWYITVIAVVAAVSWLYFEYFGYRLRSVLKRFHRSTHQLPPRDPRNLEHIDDLLNRPEFFPLTAAWQHYRTQLDNRQDSDGFDTWRSVYPDLRSSFSYQRLVQTYGQRRLAEVIPPTLTAIGILGTFIGLVAGVPDLGGLDLEQLRLHISTLLGGMSIAFNSSVVAILSSILWSVSDRLALRATQSRLLGFYDRIETLLPIGEPTDLMQRLIDVQRDNAETTRKLFSDELIPAFGNSLREVVQDTLSPGVKMAMSAVERFAQEASVNQAKGITEIVESVTTGFRNTFNGRLTALSDAVRDMADWQTTVQANVDNLLAVLQDAAAGQTEVLQTTTSLLSSARDVTGDLSGYEAAISDAAQSMGPAADSLVQLNRECNTRLRQLVADEERIRTLREDYLDQLLAERETLVRTWSSIETNVDSLCSTLDTQVSMLANALKASTLPEELREAVSGAVNEVERGAKQTIGHFTSIAAELSASLTDLDDILTNLHKNLARVDAMGKELARVGRLYEQILLAPPVTLMQPEGVKGPAGDEIKLGLAEVAPSREENSPQGK